MQKKILIIIISMLLFSPMIVSSDKINYYKDINNNPSEILLLSDDVPAWDVDDEWVYDVTYQGELGDEMTFSWSFDNIKFLVTEATTTAYNMDISGVVTGEINIFDIQLISGQLKDTTITGSAVVDKSNIGLKEVDVVIDGKIAVVGIPLKTFTMNIEVTFDPSYGSVDFPISTGNSWMIHFSSLSGRVDLSLLNNPIYIDDSIGGDNVECIDIESVTVDAGSYNAYKIISDGDITERYYATEAGNIVKAYGDVSRLIDIELVSTNYVGGGEPGAPNTPSKPSGPSSGTPGSNYEYTSSATDNEGDQVYYWFDWGDGTNSGWLGPYDSGQICTGSNSWPSKSDYKIKVKAKDDGGHESGWSDTLNVRIAKTKSKTHLFDIIDYLLEIVPIFKNHFSIYFMKNF